MQCFLFLLLFLTSAVHFELSLQPYGRCCNLLDGARQICSCQVHNHGVHSSADVHYLPKLAVLLQKQPYWYSNAGLRDPTTSFWTFELAIY